MSPRELQPPSDGYYDRDAQGRHQFMVNVVGSGPGEINNSSALNHNIQTISPNSKPVSNKSKRLVTEIDVERKSAHMDTNIETVN